jgi:hypothetical protein
VPVETGGSRWQQEWEREATPARATPFGRWSWWSDHLLGRPLLGRRRFGPARGAPGSGDTGSGDTGSGGADSSGADSSGADSSGADSSVTGSEGAAGGVNGAGNKNADSTIRCGNRIRSPSRETGESTGQC